MLEKLNKYYDEGLLYKQVHPTLPLTIWNYTEKVQYENLWDEITLMCRGLVTDDKGNKATETRTNYITILPGWNPGDVFESAWRGLLSFFRFLYMVIVWLLIFSPVIIFVILIWYLIKRKRKFRKLESGRENQ